MVKPDTGTVRIENLSMDAIERVQNERRLPVQLLNYWDEIRGIRRFPSENDIHPEDILHLWDHCYLIQVNDLEKRQRVDFTYLGSEILKTYREHLSEEDAADIISPGSSRLAQNFRSVIESGSPVMQSGEFIIANGNTIRFRQCLLPLGLTDDKVEAIFGCARLKVFF